MREILLIDRTAQFFLGLKPVSYTHLDVYKRQVVGNVLRVNLFHELEQLIRVFRRVKVVHSVTPKVHASRRGLCEYQLWLVVISRLDYFQLDLEIVSKDLIRLN